MAIYNKKAGSLQLYFLRRPDETNLHFIQSISGDKLEDCLFFEHSGKFYMALAIQLGPSQFAKDVVNISTLRSRGKLGGNGNQIGC